MKKFYKYQHELEARYYSNLTKLCKEEQLIYSNVYHSITRLKKGFWSDETNRVTLLYFSGV